MEHVKTGEDFARPENTAAPIDQRYHYMDNLRALAMLAGVVFHAMLAHSPLMANLWLSADSQNAAWVDAVAWFSHLFRMPLFFLIAGFFAAYLLRKRGAWGLVKNRALRIALPLLVFLPLVTIATIAGIEWASQHVAQPSPMLGLIKWLQTLPEQTPPPFSFSHLWFLYQLCLFIPVWLLLSRLGILARLARFDGLGAWPAMLLLPILTVPALLSQTAPHPAPDGLMPHGWSFGFYGLFFLFGSYLFGQQTLLERLRPHVSWMLAGSVALYAVYFYFMPKSVSMEQIMAQGGQPDGLTVEHIAMAVAGAFVSWWMTLSCLVLGKRLLDRASGAMRYVADASYWIYLIHLPLLFWIQFALLDFDGGLWVKLALLVVSTMLLGLISYALLVRWTPIGWLLNGRKSRRRPTAASHAEPIPDGQPSS
ncbi:MAG: acyltransferase family protein [Pseudomonadota bacterium]